MSEGTVLNRRSAGRIWERAIVVLAYLLGHGLMFLNKGIYWDDWMYFRQPWALVAGVSTQLGSIWPSWTLAALYQSDASVWITRIVVAVCYLLVAVWFLEILRDVGVDRPTRIVMALCFALFPVNGARIPIATAAYGVALALFVAGFLLVIASMRRRSTMLRSAAALALLLSLRVSSFGVFLPIIYAYVIWREGASREPRRWLSIALRRAELLAVPVAYLLLRRFVFVQSGDFSDYNTATAGSLLGLPRGVVAGLWHSVVQPLALGVGKVASVAGLFGALAILVALLVVYPQRAVAEPGDIQRVVSRRRSAEWLAVGLGLTTLAILPYLLVGKMPALTDFSSRHQLLVPFGAAIMMGAGLRLLFGASRNGTVAMLSVAALLFGGFASADIDNNVSYLRERYKHIAMVEAIRTQPEFRDATTFVFADRTLAFNANYRSVTRASEYAGMMNLALGGQTRFGADATEFAIEGIAHYRASFTAKEWMSDYRERPIQYVIQVVPGALDLASTRTILELLTTDILRPSRLPVAARDAVRLLPVRR